MRALVGFVSAVLGLIAGWVALALFVIAVAGHDRDGGIAMGAFFFFGPIGGLVGLVAGIVVFRRWGLVRGAAPEETEGGGGEPRASQVSRPYAAVVLAIAAGLAGWAWVELLR